ncbi:MAG: hypothetical protein LBP94_02315 [Zoogloeaceae bacterium]|nr:hypothetical protein [Zoogloeaceae bacterium]
MQFSDAGFANPILLWRSCATGAQAAAASMKPKTGISLKADLKIREHPAARSNIFNLSVNGYSS